MPGQAAQPIHRDRWAWGARLRGFEPQLNTIWALTDFTTENGATRVVPGSSDWPDDRKAEAHEITQAVMDAGAVLLYTGTVFHGGGENRSDGDRTGLNITYALGWLRQEENQYLSCPPEIARTLDPELQALIGYSMGQYALGYYTPPLPPGAGPEVVPPEHAVRGDADGIGARHRGQPGRHRRAPRRGRQRLSRAQSVEHEADAPVALALGLDLGDAERPRLAGVRQVRAAARLAIDAVDLDDPQLAVGRRRRGDRQAAHEPGASSPRRRRRRRPSAPRRRGRSRR